MPTMDQVAWANCNVTVGGDTTPFGRGSLLPEPTTPEESAERSTLRLIGAIRTVEVVFTPEELAEQARQRGASTAAREAALDVDSSLPLGQQTAGTAQAGPPTMVEPSGSPVVIGDEPLRDELEQAQRAADSRAEESRARPPGGNAPKQAWVDFAVDHRGADRDEAGQLSRDQLASRYANPAQENLEQTSMGQAAQAADAGGGAGQEDQQASQEDQQQAGQEDQQAGQDTAARQGTARQDTGARTRGQDDQASAVAVATAKPGQSAAAKAPAAKPQGQGKS